MEMFKGCVIVTSHGWTRRYQEDDWQIRDFVHWPNKTLKWAEQILGILRPDRHCVRDRKSM